MNKNNLDPVWILFTCGSIKFAINKKYVVFIEDFKNAECIYIDSNNKMKRGIFSLLGVGITVLDGRFILGEESTTNKKLNNIRNYNDMLSELELYLDYIDSYLINNKSTEILFSLEDKEKYNELNIEDLKIYKWATEKSDIDIINKNKDVIKNYLKEIVHHIDNAKNNEAQMINHLKLANKTREHIEKQINKCLTAQNNSIQEKCLIIRHNDKVYGLTFDKVDYMTDKVEAKPAYSEYKVIAGKCKYEDKNYNIINIKYLTELSRD